jgi:hypothetical protein
MMKRPKPISGFKKLVGRNKPAIDEVVREPTAGGVVFRRSIKKPGEVEILLIQDSKGRWTIPKNLLRQLSARSAKKQAFRK